MPFQIIRNDITNVEADAIFDDLKRYIAEHYVDERNVEEYRIDGYPTAPSNLPGYGRAESARRRPRRPTLYSTSGGMRPKTDAKPKEEAVSASHIQSLDDVLGQSEKTFSEHLLDLLKERDGKDSEVYKRAEVSKQLFSKILNNPDYQPTKTTAIQLAIGLQLDLAQTQKLLETAGYALTRSSKADLVVQYCIERGIYSVTFINEALYDCGLPLLKTGLKT